MVRRVTYYSTVEGFCVADVCNKVNEKIEEGYEPLGGITFGKDVSEKVWVQTLVQYD